MPHNIPEQENDILQNLLSIRNKLTVLKRHSSFKASDIDSIRLETVQQVDSLRKVRNGVLFREGIDPNRLDSVLEDVCQIISLCFLTMGKIGEVHAVYSQVVAIKQCFDRLKDVGIYAEEFLVPYQQKLKSIEEIIEHDSRNKVIPESLLEVIHYKFHQCKKIYARLLDTIHELDPDLIPVRNRLLRIRRQLGITACRSYFNTDDLLPLQQEIREINNQRVNNSFNKEGTQLAGQESLDTLMEQVLFMSDDLVVATQPDFSPSLQILRNRLVEIKSQLERLELTHKWTLRQTDLYEYQHQLKDIINMQMEEEEEETGKVFPKKQARFVDEQGNVPQGQTVLLCLLQKCYRMILILLNESVPVSEALTPIYNQLVSVRQCLRAVKNIGAPCSEEELYPYQMKLMSIERLRKDDKFYDKEGGVPEGQAVCAAVLKESYQILAELRECKSPANSTDK